MAILHGKQGLLCDKIVVYLKLGNIPCEKVTEQYDSFGDMRLIVSKPRQTRLPDYQELQQPRERQTHENIVSAIGDFADRIDLDQISREVF